VPNRDETGVQVISNRSVLKIVIILTLGCSLFAYFSKPKATLLSFGSPKDLLPTFEERFPGDTRLSDRVIKSYALAMVLVQTPFTQNNVTSLEMIREWSRDQFQRHPDFLHPVSVIVDHEKRDTVFGAVGYTILAPVKFWLAEQSAYLLRMRINNFHGSSAFRSFSKAYFDFFGKDSDSATLLTLYESERARQAVDVLPWFALWLCSLSVSAVLLFRARQHNFFLALQRVLSGAWLLVGIEYLFQSWDGGQLSTLVSGVIAMLIAAYLMKPFIFATHQEGGQQLLFIRLAPRWVALSFWLTMSVFAVQILTWVRTGLPNASDPVTLLLCSASGNFVHEPVAGKRLITNVVACIWVLCSFWSWRQRDKSEAFAANEDEVLRSLDRSVDFQATL
jgi:hypothetical protein